MRIQVFPSIGSATGEKQWYARIRNKGRTMMTSEGYKRRRGAENCARSVRGNSIEGMIEVVDEKGKVIDAY